MWSGSKMCLPLWELIHILRRQLLLPTLQSSDCTLDISMGMAENQPSVYSVRLSCVHESEQSRKMPVLSRLDVLVQTIQLKVLA